VRGAGITEIGGSVRVLDLGEPRRPAADEVLIAVKAAGVGNWDNLVRMGEWNVGGKPPTDIGRQLTTVFWSEIASAEGEDTGETAEQLSQSLDLARLVGELEVRESAADVQVGAHWVFYGKCPSVGRQNESSPCRFQLESLWSTAVSEGERIAVDL
jgi:hypothetical protein